MPTISETPAGGNPESGSRDPKAIPYYDRFVLWMFLLGFVIFAVILLGDLLTVLLR
jgi:hypothetical protein